MALTGLAKALVKCKHCTRQEGIWPNVSSWYAPDFGPRFLLQLSTSLWG